MILDSVGLVLIELFEDCFNELFLGAVVFAKNIVELTDGHHLVVVVEETLEGSFAVLHERLLLQIDGRNQEVLKVQVAIVVVIYALHNFVQLFSTQLAEDFTIIVSIGSSFENFLEALSEFNSVELSIT